MLKRAARPHAALPLLRFPPRRAALIIMSRDAPFLAFPQLKAQLTAAKSKLAGAPTLTGESEMVRVSAAVSMAGRAAAFATADAASPGSEIHQCLQFTGFENGRADGARGRSRYYRFLGVGQVDDGHEQR